MSKNSDLMNVDFSAFNTDIKEVISKIHSIRKPLPSLEVSYAKMQLEEQQEANRIAEEYQQESLKILRSIEQNTANLYTLVDLISKNNEHQEELVAIIAEVLSIATAKTKDEAENKYRAVMDKITKKVKDVEAMSKMVGYANTVWTLVQPIIEKLPPIGG